MKKEIIEKTIDSKKNLIISGDIATGKTANVIFPLVQEMINNNESLLLLDSKEEYINRFYNELKEKNYNIIILNLRDMDKSEGWNPLEYPYELYKKGDVDAALEYIEKIGKMIFDEPKGTDPFWTNAASDFFTSIVLILFDKAKKEEINLNSVNALIEATNGYNSTDVIADYIKTKGVTSKEYIYAATTVFAPKETKASILSIARQKLRLYTSREKLSMLMNKTTFDFNDIKTKSTAVFVIGREESKFINNVATMFIEQLFKILLNLKANNKFNFILDNFDTIEYINEFVEMLGAAASRNIKFIMSTRYLEQITNKYSIYAIKLSNLINIINEKIDITINNQNEVIENDFETVEFTESNIIYPIIPKPLIMTFKPLKLKVLDKPVEKVDVNELIKKIDEKIAELEKEEQAMGEKSIKSELQQFKINE